jgi:hypothetical protein
MPQRAIRVAPHHRLHAGGKASLRAVVLQAELVLRIALVRKDIAHVVENNIENHVSPLRVRCIHQFTQLIVRVRRILGKPRLRAQKVVDAVPVVRVQVEIQVAQRRADPDRARAQLFQVRQLRLDAAKTPALKLREIRVIKRRMVRRPQPVVKPVDHQKVNPLVAPVFWRWRKGKPACSQIPDRFEDRLEISSKFRRR